MLRFYFVPKVGDGLSHATAFRPKYVDPGELGVGLDLGGAWQAMDYGSEDVFLIGTDVTPEQHTALSAQTDVLAVPALNQQVSAVALATVQAKLEAMHLPAEWVTTAMTYRQVVRAVALDAQNAEVVSTWARGVNDTPVPFDRAVRPPGAIQRVQ